MSGGVGCEVCGGGVGYGNGCTHFLSESHNILIFASNNIYVMAVERCSVTLNLDKHTM